jgi:hypothetical protein
VDAVFQQRDADGMMKSCGSCHDGGIDFTEQIVIIGQDRRLAIGFREPSRLRQRINNADDFNAVYLLSQPGVDAPKMSGPNDCQANPFAHAVVLE